MSPSLPNGELLKSISAQVQLFLGAAVEHDVIIELILKHVVRLELLLPKLSKGCFGDGLARRSPEHYGQCWTFGTKAYITQKVPEGG